MATPRLTIDQARERRMELERIIEDAIAQFEQDSGSVVDSIDLFQARLVGAKRSKVSIKASIKL